MNFFGNHRHTKFFLAVFLSMAATAHAQGEAAPRYDIQATVDVKTKTIAALQTTTFRNPGAQDLSEIVFHIYPNRFYTRREKSFIQRFAGYFKVNPFPQGFQDNGMEIQSVTGDQGDLKFFIEGDDRTLLRVALARPVKPGDSVTVAIHFSAAIPNNTIGRFGWQGDVFKISRWYPILAVFEGEKGWNRHPFYPFHRPFYSEAAFYKVALTVPADHVVAHSGELAGQRNNSDGTTTFEYDSSKPIREFSFAMSPEYRVVAEDFDGVTISSFYLPGTEKSARAALSHAKDLMRFYGKLFGKYPYRFFSIAPVDLGYGGEQMANLIFIDRRSYQMPGLLARYFDFLVAHEIGHQWFYNLIGIDEFTQMWLEEGVNSYFIEQYLEDKYGRDGAAEVIDYPDGFKPWEWTLPKLTFHKTRDTRYKAIARIGFDHSVVGELSSFHEPSSIFSVTYGKGARVLGMLKSYIGQEAFERVFKRIFAEYAFKNLSVNDFIRLCEEESGQKLSWFFDQWLFGDGQFNYAVAGVRGDTIQLQNRGAIKVPADVQVDYCDGRQEILSWDGQKIREEITLKNKSAVRRVVIDPGEKLLDIDRTNNVWPRRLHLKVVPLYFGIYEIPVFLPEDGYTLTVGPELANSGFGLKASWQKPYEQIFYAGSDYEFGEQLLHSRVGYQLKNLFKTQTSLGVELSNTTDYEDGDDDRVSGKVSLRRELWPVQYGLTALNDHVSLYLIRNQHINDGADFISGREGTRNVDYSRRREAIVGTALHLERSGPYPDPHQGYKIDTFVESAGHFLGGTQFFYRSAMDGGFYVPITTKTTAALRLKYGWGYPEDKQLFYLGGMDALRGYDLKTVRGANIVLGTLEYRFPIKENLKLSLFDNILGLESVGGVVFFDAGQGWFSEFDDARLRKDAGAGLRLTVNIGSFLEKVVVRVDVAQAINDSAEDTHFWFGVNHAF